MATLSYVIVTTPVVVIIANGATTQTVTVNCTNPNLVYFAWNGFITTKATVVPSNFLPRVEKTSTTASSITFTVTRAVVDAATVTLFATVVEFGADAVESIQYGTTTLISTTTANTAITAVDPSRSCAAMLGLTTTGTTNATAQCSGTTLDSGGAQVNVTIAQNTASTVISAWCVIQFKVGVVMQKEQVVVGATNTQTGLTFNCLNFYDLTKTVIIYGGVTGSNVAPAIFQMRGLLSGVASTILTMTRQSSTNVTRNYYCEIFQLSFISSLQNITNNLSNA